MTEIKIFENFLNDEVFFDLKSALHPGGGFPWGFHLSNVAELGPEIHLRNNQFSHVLYQHEPLEIPFDVMGQLGDRAREDCPQPAKIIAPVLQEIDPFILVRAKVNLLTYSGETSFFGGFHTDTHREDICVTGILYLDTCDGPTEFEGGKKVDAVANRLVTFPAFVRHGSWTATDVPYRRVINFNWIPF